MSNFDKDTHQYWDVSPDSHHREYVDRFESDEVGQVEVYSGENGYVGVSVNGDEQYPLVTKQGNKRIFVTHPDCDEQITLYPVDDGFFKSAQPIPRFIRRLVGLE